jgi:hypothetical protein
MNIKKQCAERKEVRKRAVDKIAAAKNKERNHKRAVVAKKKRKELAKLTDTVNAKRRRKAKSERTREAARVRKNEQRRAIRQAKKIDDRVYDSPNHGKPDWYIP